MLKIYLDTSVYCGYFDEEFKDTMQPLFERIMDNEFEVMQSNLLVRELLLAPQRVKDLYNAVPDPKKIVYDENSINLAKKYIEEGVVGETSLSDCIHISVATIYKADLLISCNFKDMVNITKIIEYNSVNEQEGYKKIEIRSPREI